MPTYSYSANKKIFVKEEKSTIFILGKEERNFSKPEYVRQFQLGERKIVFYDSKPKG